MVGGGMMAGEGGGGQVVCGLGVGSGSQVVDRSQVVHGFGVRSGMYLVHFFLERLGQVVHGW